MSHLVSLDQQAPVVASVDAVGIGRPDGSDAVGSDHASASLALVRTGPTAVDRRRRTDHGLVSAEWAMAIIAAVAIVGVLVAIIKSGPVEELLISVVKAIIAAALKLI